MVRENEIKSSFPLSSEAREALFSDPALIKKIMLSFRHGGGLCNSSLSPDQGLAEQVGGQHRGGKSQGAGQLRRGQGHAAEQGAAPVDQPDLHRPGQGHEGEGRVLPQPGQQIPPPGAFARLSAVVESPTSCKRSYMVRTS